MTQAAAVGQREISLWCNNSSVMPFEDSTESLICYVPTGREFLPMRKSSLSEKYCVFIPRPSLLPFIPFIPLSPSLLSSISFLQAFYLSLLSYSSLSHFSNPLR
jgi:hypothetical protein